MQALTVLAVAASAAAQLVHPANSVAFNQLGGSRTSVIIDETPVGKYLFPPSRGASKLVSGVAPCQGYELAGRINYPISGGVISWSTLVDIGDIRIRYSTAEDPTSLDQFEDALTNITGGWKGQQCIDGPNFAALGLTEGTNITMQFSYAAGPKSSEGFECADLTLVSEEAFAEDNFETSCVNYVQTTKQRGDGASNPPLVTLREEAEAEALAEAEASLVPTSSGGLSVAEGGVIGAMVTLGTFLAVLGLAWMTGFITFGRRAERKSSGVGSEKMSRSSSSV